MIGSAVSCDSDLWKLSADPVCEVQGRGTSGGRLGDVTRLVDKGRVGNVWLTWDAWWTSGGCGMSGGRLVDVWGRGTSGGRLGMLDIWGTSGGRLGMWDVWGMTGDVGRLGDVVWD